MKIALIINGKIKKLYDNSDWGKARARNDMQLFRLYPDQYPSVYIAPVRDNAKCRQRVVPLTR